MTTRRPNDFLQERLVFVHEHGASKLLGDQISLSYDNASLTADLTVVLFKAQREFLLEAASYYNATGLVADVTNFMDIQLVETAVVMANWSTETGQEGTIAAAGFVDLTLGTVANRTLAAGEKLSIFFEEGGAVTLPVGLLQIEGRYYEAGITLAEIFKAKRQFLVEQVRYVNPTGLAADASNHFDIQVKNGATVVANWSTETGEEGALTADLHVDLSLSTVAGALLLDVDDVLSLNLAETGTQTLPAGRIQIEGRYI